ncbi:MAG: FG-GAP-like repeat-containing protein [Pseudomonadales bacterium]|nr:FG-GAP-like repeat-containing protein [Pseudomonadales bacterium]
MTKTLRLVAVANLLFSLCLPTACSKDKQLNQQLRNLIKQHHLDQPFQADSQSPSPLLADLGGDLFFSPDLSIDGSVACASCHHPSRAGTDGLSLPIGIGGVDSENIGPARLDAAKKNNDIADLQGFIPRNSPSVFNVAFYRKRLFWDGRVQYQESLATDDSSNTDKKTIIAGFGAAQHNPSNYLQENLLQTQARMPITSSFEMKGNHFPNRNSHEIEQDILSFLQSQERWCSAFARVYGIKSCDQLITLNNLTKALAAFQATLLFTDSPFQRFIEGDVLALNQQQKRGAITFLSSAKNGGGGCINCHNGKFLTNENFYNINIPPSGRGANDNGWDLGRHNVDKAAERFSFRVPTLLNVAHTGPYFHNGTVETLEDAISFMQLDPPEHSNETQIKLANIDYAKVSQAITDAFETGAAKSLLPNRLSDSQVKDLAAFLRSLSDQCLVEESCLDNVIRQTIKSPRQRNITRHQDNTPNNTLRSVNHTPQPPNIACKKTATVDSTPSLPLFTPHSLDIGITHQREVGLIKKGWLIDIVNYASVSALDLDYDCLDDLVFDAGSRGIKVYMQQPDGNFALRTNNLQLPPGAVNALVTDIDGDYQFDLFVGNYGQSSAQLIFNFQNQTDDIAQISTLSGPVISTTTGDIDGDGDLDAAFAMWRSFSSMKQPHLFYNDGNGNLSAENGFIELRQHEKHVSGDQHIKRQANLDIGVSDLTFTPNFADINNDGQQDLLLASDFFRSQVLVNKNGKLSDTTNKEVIDETNGMGATVGDFDNNGTMDWFVTSIVDKTTSGLAKGHRLYINKGDGVFARARIPNKDIEWSWGTCSADFNNDGLLDIFYISGYGEPLDTAKYETEPQKAASKNFLDSLTKYRNSTPTLLINNGGGQFEDRSKAYGFTEPFDGRGVACIDYQQDGDIDIIVAPLEGSPVLFRNNQSNDNNWIAFRFIGPAGNTEAFGTRVELSLRSGTQTRIVKFENNFVSRNSAQLHFGIGKETNVDRIKITTPAPDKKEVILSGLELNRLHILKVSEL